MERLYSWPATITAYSPRTKVEIAPVLPLNRTASVTADPAGIATRPSVPFTSSVTAAGAKLGGVIEESRTNLSSTGTVVCAASECERFSATGGGLLTTGGVTTGGVLATTASAAGRYEVRLQPVTETSNDEISNDETGNDKAAKGLNERKQPVYSI